MIIREDYLKKIEVAVNTEFIKVITGVRRSGKSYLLLMVRDLLLERGVKEDQIIYMNFENPDYRQFLNFDSLYTYIQEQASKTEKMYFLFDEIQEVTEWQKLINGLRIAYDSDIYITGSNASLLSGELATYLTGRYIEIPVYPLSLQEYMIFKDYKQQTVSRHLSNYLTYGGFPSVVLTRDENLQMDVLSGIFNSVLLKDVVKRASIKEPELLERIANFLLDNVGQEISVNKIANSLRSSGRKVSNSTIDSYLSLLEDAFIFYKVRRYDIRGKEYLNGQAKYYTVDLGFILSQLHKTTSNRGSKIENLVYIELRRRGYQVFVGRYNGKEVDFVATKGDETIYIQVTERIPEENSREQDNLLHLPVGHQKMIITNSWNDVGQIEGIPVVHLEDFLMGEV